MKRILVALVMSTFGYLAAAAHDAAYDNKPDDRIQVLSKDQYFLLPVEDADPVVNYRVESKHRILKPGKDVTWEHGDSTSTLSIRYFLTLDTGKAYLSEEDTVTKIFPHVAVRPESVEERASVLWKATESTTRTLQHHVPTGGKKFTQWELKQGFHIYKYDYTCSVVSLWGLIDGQEKPITVVELGRSCVRRDKITGPRGKDTWYNDPAGQGSNGPEPQEEVEKLERFKTLFPQYREFF